MSIHQHFKKNWLLVTYFCHYQIFCAVYIQKIWNCFARINMGDPLMEADHMYDLILHLSKYTLIYPLFCATIFFTFVVQSHFKQAAVVYSLFQVIVSSPKQAPVISRQWFLSSSKSSVVSWSDPVDPIPPLLLYIKPPLPINKQFSIDSFLDWEGLHWDFSSTIAYPPYVDTFSASAPTPKHQTRYIKFEIKIIEKNSPTKQR